MTDIIKQVGSHLAGLSYYSDPRTRGLIRELIADLKATRLELDQLKSYGEPSE
jgi:hypothetical protein